jgi:hypothetical protein
MKKLAKKKLVLRSDVIRVLRAELLQIVGGNPPEPIDSDPEPGPPCSEAQTSCGICSEH